MLIKLLSIILGGVAVYFIIWWIRELIFYSGNNWDFSKQFGLEFYFGGEGGFTRRMTPKQKLCFGYPLIVCVSLITFVAVAAIVF